MKLSETIQRTIRDVFAFGRTRLAQLSPPLLIIALSFAVYLYKPFIQSSRDNMPLRWGATLLATRGTLNFAELPIDPNRFYSLKVLDTGEVRSHTPVGTALLAAPIFLLARVLGMEFTDETVVFLDSLAATLLTALSAGLATHLARHWGRRAAVFVGLALAFGTASWSTASRCLWQHTGALFTMLCALCVLDGSSRRLLRLIAGGAILAFCFWCRPALAPTIAVIVVLMLVQHRREAIFVGVGAVVVLGGWIIYNIIAYGKPLGTYLSLSALGPDTLSAYPRRLFGHLFAPNRGMFVFSPVLLLTIAPMFRNARQWRENRWLAMLSAAALVGILARGFFYGWFGGHCYGSRYSLDSAPLMLIGAAPLFAKLLESARRAILPIGFLAISGAIQFLGVARDYESWNILMGMSKEDNAWNWRLPQILHCLTCGEWTRGPVPSASMVNLPPNGVIEVRRDPNSPFIRYGFTYLEPGGPWIVPPKAGIIFNLPQARSLRLRCEAVSQVFPYDPTTIGLYMNGKKFGELVLLKADWTFAEMPWFDVPQSYVRDGLNTLELRVSRVCYPYGSPQPGGAMINRVLIIPQ
ncbi:MAG: hypothetical protein N2Z21_00415 [Candidatus Sumerlaeaceae bacterium]|nr:hypothetical protein [Candidatus Sumerlaeaceae bacterium]